ncbi:aldo/keto reductase [Luteimonas aestuarii]|uniref:Aldo/keto reductase n=1 Tax=Luteimonas aestuarii TaxID=453837 RepID=A0A4R5TVE4_9GAMM|nr:aldo/keto reductase [Luteimonas aestuarii]TDK25038.1 aldo/keto reductase [Luteimonas aestuarii]
MTHRRDFLTSVGLAATGLALAPLAACSQDAPRVPSTPLDKPLGAIADATPLSAALLARPIPSSGEMLPVIGAGTSGSYEVPLASGEFQDLREVAKVFFDGGATVIDTSPNYSNAEDVVGALLEDGGWRDRCFLATKLAADSRDALERQWADSLRRLRTDRVELLQVHNLRNLGQALPYARELQQQGLAKYIGITHYLESGHAETARIMRDESPDFVQINYSVNAPQAARAIFPLAQERGIAVVVNRAFDDGRLFAMVRDKPLPGWADDVEVTSWAQLFLKFVVSHPAVTVVIPATGRPERQADNLRGGIGPLLDEEQQAELVRTFA